MEGDLELQANQWITQSKPGAEEKLGEDFPSLKPYLKAADRTRRGTAGSEEPPPGRCKSGWVTRIPIRSTQGQQHPGQKKATGYQQSPPRKDRELRKDMKVFKEKEKREKKEKRA